MPQSIPTEDILRRLDVLLAQQSKKGRAIYDAHKVSEIYKLPGEGGHEIYILAQSGDAALCYDDRYDEFCPGVIKSGTVEDHDYHGAFSQKYILEDALRGLVNATEIREAWKKERVVIAERHYESVEGKQVTLKFMLPEPDIGPFSHRGDYVCYFSIDGLKDVEPRHQIRGTDSVSALDLAFKFARSALVPFVDELKLHGATTTDLGFCRDFSPMLLGKEFVSWVEALINLELRRKNEIHQLKHHPRDYRPSKAIFEELVASEFEVSRSNSLSEELILRHGPEEKALALDLIESADPKLKRLGRYLRWRLEIQTEEDEGKRRSQAKVRELRASPVFQGLDD